MSEKVDLIYDLVKIEREESLDFRKEVRESNQNTYERLSKIEVLDEAQNRHLEEHIRRTNILEDLHKESIVRIEKLEEPRKVFSTMKKWLIGIGAIAGAVFAIVRLLGLI